MTTRESPKSPQAKLDAVGRIYHPPIQDASQQQDQNDIFRLGDLEKNTKTLENELFEPKVTGGLVQVLFPFQWYVNFRFHVDFQGYTGCYQTMLTQGPTGRELLEKQHC